MGLLLLTFLAAAPPSLDACDATAATAEVQALAQASHDVDTGDVDQVRAAVAQVRKTSSGDPYLLLWSGALLAAVKDPEAPAVFNEAIAAAQALARDPSLQPAAELYEAAAEVRLGHLEAGLALLERVRARPGALATYACRFIPLAQALSDHGQGAQALALLAAVQAAKPTARSVADARLELALRSGVPEAIEAAFAAARGAFPADVEFIVRQANRAKVTQGRDAALALLDPLLLPGVATPSLLGEYLGLLSADPSDAKRAHYQALLDAHPDVPALELMVGVLDHYLHHYESSTVHLERAGDLARTEPRVAMYLAMNAFHTPGQEARAETYIEQAARAGRPDPDIYYCRAVIEVRKNPAAAVRDLERYLALTEPRPDVAPEKQQRVKQTLALLNGCVADADPRQCVQREVVEQAKALAFAEHFGPPRAAPEEPSDPAPARNTGRLIALVAVLALLGWRVLRTRRSTP